MAARSVPAPIVGVLAAVAVGLVAVAAGAQTPSATLAPDRIGFGTVVVGQVRDRQVAYFESTGGA